MKDKELLEKFKMNVAINNLKKELLEERTLTKENNGRNDMKNSFKIGVAACLMVVSISGMVFAKEISTKIYENFFGTGKGMETAINEGYIESPEMEYENSVTNLENEETGQKIEGADTKVKVDEFVMDDFNLSLTFDVELSENVKEIITAEEIGDISFPDLLISDENDIVLYCITGKKYEEWSQKNNLNLGFNEALDNGELIGSGAGFFAGEKNGNHIKVIYNIYTGGDVVFPKSKKLKIDMNQIKLSKNPEVYFGDEEITLTGNWNFEVDVPEKMYARKNILYKQKSTTNKDFNVLQATVYNTGTDIKLKFKAQKHEKEPTTEKIEFWKSLPENDKLKNVDILNYLEREIRYTDEYIEYSQRSFDIWQYDKYLENEDGKKFEMTMGTRENGGGFIDDDGIYESNVTFDLTKYDATDTVTVYVDYKGNKAEIVLEKVGE